MESRDWIQTLAETRHSQSEIGNTSVGESDALSSSVTVTEALTTSGQASVPFASHWDRVACVRTPRVGPGESAAADGESHAR
jgi:hypothetical protein